MTAVPKDDRPGNPKVTWEEGINGKCPAGCLCRKGAFWCSQRGGKVTDGKVKGDRGESGRYRCVCEEETVRGS